MEPIVSQPRHHLSGLDHPNQIPLRLGRMDPMTFPHSKFAEFTLFAAILSSTTVYAESILNPVCLTTPRVTTNWIKHSLDKAGCLSHARSTLETLNYLQDPTSDSYRSIFGSRDNSTASIRCDYDGVAFFVISYSSTLNQATESEQMQSIISHFSTN